MGKRAKVNLLQYLSDVQDLLYSNNRKMLHETEAAIAEEAEELHAKSKCESIFPLLSSIVQQCRDAEAKEVSQVAGCESTTVADSPQYKGLADVAASLDGMKEDMRLYVSAVAARENIERKSEILTEAFVEGAWVKEGLKKKYTTVRRLEEDKRKEKEERLTAQLNAHTRLKELQRNIGTVHTDTIETEQASLKHLTPLLKARLQDVSQESIHIQHKREQLETLSLTREDLRSAITAAVSSLERVSQHNHLLSTQELHIRELQVTIKAENDALTAAIEKLNIKLKDALFTRSEAVAEFDLRSKKTIIRQRIRCWENSLMQVEELKTELGLLRSKLARNKQQVVENQQEFARKGEEITQEQKRQTAHVQEWFRGEWKEKAVQREQEQGCEKLDDALNKRRSVREREIRSSYKLTWECGR